MTIDLDALRRQAEACGDPMAMHPSVVLELLDEIAAARCDAGLAGGEVDDLRAKLEDKLTNWVVCYHCYETMPAPDADDHGRVCPKHPQRKVEAERDALASQVAMARWFVEGFRIWWGEVRNRRMEAGPLDFDVEIATDTIKRCDLFLDKTAQAAAEYRERIVREAVAAERERLLAMIRCPVTRGGVHEWRPGHFHDANDKAWCCQCMVMAHEIIDTILSHERVEARCD